MEGRREGGGDVDARGGNEANVGCKEWGDRRKESLRASLRKSKDVWNVREVRNMGNVMGMRRGRDQVWIRRRGVYRRS